MKKIISYLVAFFASILVIGICCHYYITKPKEFPSEMCWKGKYLIQLDGHGSVYTRVKELVCELEGDIIILENK